MSSRKIEVEVTVKLSLAVNEGQEISDILDEMDYNFEDTTGNADIVDTELIDYNVLAGNDFPSTM